MIKHILFDVNKKVIDVVVVETEGLFYVLFTGKEVILSAGVFNSSQLSTASGAGSANILRDLNIFVVADRSAVNKACKIISYDISYRVSSVNSLRACSQRYFRCGASPAVQ